MKVLDNIISFFNRIFKKDKTKMLNEPNNIEVINESANKEEIIKQDNSEKLKQVFINSLKIGNLDDEYSHKRKVKTRICLGDGLGILNDFSA